MSHNLPDRMVWDAVVVGAGPAGAAAACSLARSGLQVLLVDAKPFPRRKVCGGCLNQVSSQLLQQLLGEDHPLWQTSVPLDSFELSHEGQAWRFDLPTGYAVDRGLLDHSLVTRATQLGATFNDATTAKLLASRGNYRELELSHASGTRRVPARVVVLAGGLGNHAAGINRQLHHQAATRSRVGVEAIFENFPQQFRGGTIHMVVGREGYVGLTQIAGGRLHVAAAVDRPAVQSYGPAGVVQHILRQAGAAQLDDDTSVLWRGTPPLTSRPLHLAERRVFLVGDAAGYVEPFTGEGIRWALQSGIGVAPLVVRAVSAWEDSLVLDWEGWYAAHIARRQRLCRRISWGLKHSATRWLAAHALRLRPRLAAAMINHLNTH